MLSEQQRFRDYYRSLDDHDLARLALTEDLVPEARAAVNEELAVRGLSDLSQFKQRMREDAAWVRQSQADAPLVQRRQQELLNECVLVPCAWVLASLGPFMALWPGRPSDRWALAALAAPLGLSIWLGLRARRAGRRLVYHLEVTVPLALLVISSMAALVMAIS